MKKVLFLSAGFMFLEIAGGIFSGSLALLADSGHMAIDTAAVALGLFAIWVGKKPPTDQRTYGYHRAEILAATVNGALLVLVALWIFYEAWERFGVPRQINGPWMTTIAVGGLVVNLVALRLVSGKGHSHSSLNIKAVRLHLFFDALGSVGAILAGLFVWGWGWNWADSMVSVLIGLLILQGAFQLLVECTDILLESVPAGVDLAKVRQDLMLVEGVTDVHDLHVWSLASGVTALSAHLCTKQKIDFAKVLHASNAVLRDSHRINHATLQLEPEGYSHDDSVLDCQKVI